MDNYTGGLNYLKSKMLNTMKMNIDIMKYSSECVCYKVSKEEMDRDLSKYKNKKGFISFR